MRRKLKMIVLVSFLLTLVNISIAGISTSGTPAESTQVEPSLLAYTQQLVYHADAGKPYSGAVNQPIQFDGSGTYINPTEGATYVWDFDDGTIGTGKNPIHIYSKSGIYYVSLTVTTTTDKVYMDDTVVYIDQEADYLVPYGRCNYYADINETITFDASNSISTDPSNPIVEYKWFFGDGGEASGKQVTHSFDTSRVYYVTLVVKDSKGSIRHDFLHADIGCDYTSIYDTYLNVGSTLEIVFDTLFNKLNLPQGIILNHFDARIYTKYVPYGTGTPVIKDPLLSKLLPFPREIDVTGNNNPDIKLNNLKFLSIKKGPSLFADDGGLVWFQFETTLSSIDKTSNSDIQPQDNFTICLQFKFGQKIADYLGLDTPLCRIGYNSPSGEAMPNHISITHIFKPYLIPNLISGGSNSYSLEQSSSSQYSSNEPSDFTNQEQSSKSDFYESTTDTGSTDVGEASSTKTTNIETQGITGGEEGQTIENTQEAEYLHYITHSNPIESTDLENGNYPEYGFYLDSQGGGRLSLVRMFLNSETDDDTGLVLKLTTDGNSSSKMVFKMKKESGLFDRGVLFETTTSMPTISMSRIENGVVKTEISTDTYLIQQKFSKIYWGDDGPYIKFESQGSAGLKNFYFYNQTSAINLTFEKLAFSNSGFFEVSLKDGLNLNGSVGFTITNLSLDMETSNFHHAGIDGTLELNITKSVSIGFYKNGTETGLRIGFDGYLSLISNCIYEINDYNVTLHGDFKLPETKTVIKFALDDGKFLVKLEEGKSVEVENFYFKLGNLTTSANGMAINKIGTIEFSYGSGIFTINIENGPSLNVTELHFKINQLTVDASHIYIGKDGRFNVEWNTDEQSVNISGGTGSHLTIEDFNISIGNDLDITFDGSAEIDADGWINFKPYQFGVGFKGNIYIGCSITMNYQGGEKEASIGGDFELTNGGSVTFNWGDQLKITLKGGPSLTMENLVFAVGNLNIEADKIVMQADSELTITWTAESFTIRSVGKEGSLTVQDAHIEYGTSLDLQIEGSLGISANGHITVKTGFIEVVGSGNFTMEGCTLIFNNGSPVTIGGTFHLSSIGTVTFRWTSGFNLSVGSGASLAVSNFDFNAGVLSVNADHIQMGTNGRFNVSWNTQQVTISASSGANLIIDDINISSTNVHLKIDGSVGIGASGHITLKTGYVEMTGSGNFAIGCNITYNTNQVSIGGNFLMSTNGLVKFSWINGFNLSVGSGASLAVSNFDFNAGVLSVNAGYVEMGVNGNFGTIWNAQEKWINISAGGGVYLSIENVTILYTNFAFSMNNSLDIQGGGYIKLGTNTLRVSFNGELALGSDFSFEINGISTEIGGSFSIPSTITLAMNWDSTQLMFNISGKDQLSIENFHFSFNTLVINLTSSHIGANGDLGIVLQTINKLFSINGRVAFDINGFSIDYQGHRLGSLGKFNIGGGGSFKISDAETTNITFNLNGNVGIQDVLVQPPSSWGWRLGKLSIGAASYNGNVKMYIEKQSTSSGKFKVSGSLLDFSLSNFHVKDVTNTFKINLTTLSLESNSTLDLSFLFDLNNIGENHLSLGTATTGRTIAFQLKGLDSHIGNINCDAASINATFSKSLNVSLSNTTGMNRKIELKGGTVLTILDVNLSGVGWYVAIPSATIDGTGSDIAVTWKESDLKVNINQNAQWNIVIRTKNFGNWKTVGHLQGNVWVNASRNSLTGKGQVMIEVLSDTGYEYNLKIIHDPLTFEVKPVALKKGTFTFAWDVHNKIVTINNGIQTFGPTFSYSDSNLDLNISLSFNSMIGDYTKTITLKWFTDSNGKINGGYIDTSNTELAQLIEFNVTKGSNGLGIAIYGLKATNFSIQKQITGKWQLTGSLQIASRLTIDLMWNDTWHQLDFQWNLVSEPTKYVKYICNSNTDINFNLVSFTVRDWNFNVDLTLYHNTYLWAEFDFAVIDYYGHIMLDTNNQWIGALTFEVTMGTDYGIQTTFQSLYAGMYNGELPLLYWQKSPWGVGKNAAWDHMQWTGLIVKTKVSGTWQQVWPIAS